jgi:hypothetical protein
MYLEMGSVRLSLPLMTGLPGGFKIFVDFWKKVKRSHMWTAIENIFELIV